VWLPSGGSLIIERTEALTVIDVNTGKNVGKTSLEETVFKNNLEAAEEVARQLRLRDIGGIIVIDFIDMEVKKNRDEVVRVFRDALARDKTRTQVFDISELGLVEMTRKRIGEGLIESMSTTCPMCEGRGFVFDKDLLER
jgi:ribonuclease E